MGKPLRAQPALADAFVERVGNDQPHRKILDRILHEGHVFAYMPPVVENRGKVPPVVAVAGEDEIRRRQPVEQCPRGAVFLDAPVMGNIAGMDDGVGRLLQAVDPGYAGLEAGRAFGPVAGNVRVGDMDDPHGLHRSGERPPHGAGRLTG